MSYSPECGRQVSIADEECSWCGAEQPARRPRASAPTVASAEAETVTSSPTSQRAAPAGSGAGAETVAGALGPSESAPNLGTVTADTVAAAAEAVAASAAGTVAAQRRAVMVALKVLSPEYGRLRPVLDRILGTLRLPWL